MSPRLAVLNETLGALRQAADRLALTHAGVAPLFALTTPAFAALPEGDRERLDAYAIRYARCQDLLFPAMRALARAQLEPKADSGFLALFSLMQKQGITTDLDDWERQRGLRNAVSHEYPDQSAIVDILNAIWAATPEILRYVEHLTMRANEIASTGESQRGLASEAP